MWKKHPDVLKVCNGESGWAFGKDGDDGIFWMDFEDFVQVRYYLLLNLLLLPSVSTYGLPVTYSNIPNPGPLSCSSSAICVPCSIIHHSSPGIILRFIRQYYSSVDVCKRTTGMKDLALDINEEMGCVGPCRGCVGGCAAYWCMCRGCKALCCSHTSDDKTVEVQTGCCG